TVLALILFALIALPGGPSPDAVPASVVWSFRLASLGGWAAYWAVLAAVFGLLSPPAELRHTSHTKPASPDRVRASD
ncbi:MAG: CbtA family protein, partial [Actinobacteria bacterium]|nr:CbtA family protein [Actinomycetota bacterium]